jgi:RimJ/RimL family protein N-acetyltransferase
MNTLDGDVVRLEPQIEAHAEAMFDVLTDPAIYEHENEPPPSREWLRTRFRRLESRRSADGTEQWLNWVIRLPSGELAGFVQATVHASGRADIAYVLNSQHWGRGLATAAVRLMVAELAANHDVTKLVATLKRTNLRSLRLLERMGFRPASQVEHGDIDADEMVLVRAAVP